MSVLLEHHHLTNTALKVTLAKAFGGGNSNSNYHYYYYYYIAYTTCQAPYFRHLIFTIPVCYHHLCLAGS